MSLLQPDLFNGPAVAVPYFDTTALPPADLQQARETAAHQDALVLRIFAKVGRPLSPSQVWRIGIDHHGQKWLLTSVRRSITNLTSAGMLQKTGDRRPGAYNRPELVWELAA